MTDEDEKAVERVLEDVLRPVAGALKEAGSREAWYAMALPLAGFSVKVSDGYLEATFNSPNAVAPSLIAEAKAGNRDAHRILCAAVRACIDLGEPLPPELQAYAASAMTEQFDVPRKHKGDRAHVLRYRDQMVAIAVTYVAQMNYDPTRNPASKKESAASIVVAALARLGVHRSEAMVVKAWQRHGDKLSGTPVISVGK